MDSGKGLTTSHYFNQCRPRHLTPNCVTKPQWISVHNSIEFHNKLPCVHGPVLHCFVVLILSFRASLWDLFCQYEHDIQVRHADGFILYRLIVQRVPLWTCRGNLPLQQLTREFVFIIIVQFIKMSVHIRIRFGLQIVLVCLYNTPSHYHHCANLSEGIELIKCLSDIFCRVCE